MHASTSRCAVLAAVLLVAALAAPATAQDCWTQCDRDFDAAVEKCVQDTRLTSPGAVRLAPSQLGSIPPIQPPSSAEDVVRRNCRTRGQPLLDQCKAKCSPPPPPPCQAQCDIDFQAAVQKCVDDTKISAPQRLAAGSAQASTIPPIQPPSSAEDVVRRDCTERGQPLLKACKDKCSAAPTAPDCRQNCRNQFTDETLGFYICISRC